MKIEIIGGGLIFSLFIGIVLYLTIVFITYIKFNEYEPEACYIECIGDDNNPFEKGTFCSTYKILDRKGDYIKIKDVNSNEVSTRQLYLFSFVYKSRLIVSCGGK